MFLQNWKMAAKKHKVMLFILSTVMVFCNGCVMSGYELIENYEAYAELFDECGVEAEVITEGEEEYLQLVFPDQTVARYRKGLEYIRKDLEREESGELCLGEVEITIKSKKEAFTWLNYDLNDGQWRGTTYVRYVLPDFSDILPGPPLGAAQDDAMALLKIEEWITEQELADLYKMAKDMEQKMLEYDPEE